MGKTGRESPKQAENRYSMVQGGDSVGKTQVRLSENHQARVRIDILRYRVCQRGIDMGRTGRESPDRGENRYSLIQGVSGRRRHRLNWSRIARTGGVSVFDDSGCVRAEETWVRSVVNRQSEERIDIRQFRVC